VLVRLVRGAKPRPTATASVTGSPPVRWVHGGVADEGLQRSRAVTAGTKEPQVGPPNSGHRGAFQEAGQGSSLCIRLPQALRAHGHEAMVTQDRSHPPTSWEPSPSVASIVVLAGRATHVPQAAVMSGMQRTLTVTPRTPKGWAQTCDLRSRGGPKLHGMQGSPTASGLVVSDRPILFLVGTTGAPWVHCLRVRCWSVVPTRHMGFGDFVRWS
jgi:hypothetical protein